MALLPAAILLLLWIDLKQSFSSSLVALVPPETQPTANSFQHCPSSTGKFTTATPAHWATEIPSMGVLSIVPKLCGLAEGFV